MCNTFIQRPKKCADSWQARLNEAIVRLKRSLVRKSDPAAVLVGDAGDLRPALMRWGFHRPFNPSINNARSDKLAGSLWSPAFRERRCLIPVSTFFEWGPTPRGSKQAYEFSRGDDDWLWIAGLWEPSADYGDCFTMITTDAPPLMAPIHDRMPAVLDLDPALAFLTGELSDLRPYPGRLTVNACASPLKTKGKPPPDDSQGLLF